MPRKTGTISEEFARRMADVVRWAEKEMRKQKNSKKPRVRRGRHFLPVFVAELTEDLPDSGTADATLQYQDATTGDWTTSADSEDDITVHANIAGLIGSNKQLPSGCIVIVARNPATGFYNLLQSACCSEPIPP